MLAGFANVFYECELICGVVLERMTHEFIKRFVHCKEVNGEQFKLLKLF